MKSRFSRSTIDVSFSQIEPICSASLRGRILGRNPDKSFPPCYSRSPLQLCLEIFTSSKSRSLSSVQLLYTVKEKGGKPDRKPSRLSLQSLISWERRWKEKSPYKYVKKTAKIDRRKSGEFPYPLPIGLRNPYRNLKPENSQDYAQKPQRKCTFMNSASAQKWLVVFNVNSSSSFICSHSMIIILHTGLGFFQIFFLYNRQ